MTYVKGSELMTKNEIVVYQPNEQMRLDVKLMNETVWLSILQMVQLFGRERSVIAKHLKAALDEGELDATINVQNLHKNQRGRPEAYYDLDAIISVGYRVKSLRGTQFRRWATKILREHLLQGYSVNTRMNQLEDRMERRLAHHDRDISELKEKVDFFVQTQTPPLLGVFYDGQLWDACSLVERLIMRAKTSILLIDNWIGTGTLDMLAKKRSGVDVTVVTSEHKNGNGHPRFTLATTDVMRFNAQYPTLTIKFSEVFHDRFLIIDDCEIYLIGASLKDVGKKCFAFTKLDSGEIAGLKARM